MNPQRAVAKVIVGASLSRSSGVGYSARSDFIRKRYAIETIRIHSSWPTMWLVQWIRQRLREVRLQDLLVIINHLCERMQLQYLWSGEETGRTCMPWPSNLVGISYRNIVVGKPTPLLTNGIEAHLDEWRVLLLGRFKQVLEEETTWIWISSCHKTSISFWKKLDRWKQEATERPGNVHL